MYWQSASETFGQVFLKYIFYIIIVRLHILVLSYWTLHTSRVTVACIIWDINKKGKQKNADNKEQKGENAENVLAVSRLSLWAGQERD